MDKTIADTSVIIDCLQTKYGITAITLTKLPLGADMNASVYKAKARDGQAYFVKLKRGHHPDISITLLALLQASGLQQIIPPIQAIDGKLAEQIDDCTLVVYPFVEGQNGFSCHLNDDQWIVLGKALKRVHTLDLPQAIKDQIRKETYSSKWQKAVRALYTHIETATYGDEIALQFVKFMRENSLSICRLVDRAEQLAQKLQGESHDFVLCHSDIHGGNVLIAGNSSIYIVDWDDPIMAPKERDLMFIGGGVANVWNKPHEEILFYTGYGTTAVNQAILAYYRYERIVEDIAEYGNALLVTKTGNEERQEMYKQFIAMFESNGVVEIAFKSDDKSLV